MNDSTSENKWNKTWLKGCVVLPFFLFALILAICISVFFVRSCSKFIQDNKALESEEASIKAFIEERIIKTGKPIMLPDDPDETEAMKMQKQVELVGKEEVKEGSFVYRSVKHEERKEGTSSYSISGAGIEWTIEGAFETEHHQAEFWVEANVIDHSSLKGFLLVRFDDGDEWKSGLFADVGK